MVKLPVAFREKYINLLGPKEAQNLFKALSGQPKKGVRLNSLKNNYQLSSVTKTNAIPFIHHAFYTQISAQDPEWVSGAAYSQDPAAMFPAQAAAAKPGERVLDLCAAPGGKATALGEELKGQGLLVANDISHSRAQALRENIERWGLTNALITNDDPASLAIKFPSFFDLVLVDAPCSGEGMFRKDPAAISYWSIAYVRKCAQRQKKILAQAVKMLRPDGRLLYSTCTFSPEEDEEIVAWLVQKYNFQIKPLKDLGPRVDHGHPDWTKSKIPLLKGTWRFWPQNGIGEGQFVALLVNKGKRTIVTKTKTKKQEKPLRLTKKQRELIQKVLSQFNLPAALKDWSRQALVSHNHVFIPALLMNLSGLRVLSNGTELGLLKKNRFEPGHQLAEVLGQVHQDRVLDLKQKTDYLSYLHGETLRVETQERGFILVSYKHMIFSFGKLANRILKNYYPKGLRILKKG